MIVLYYQITTAKLWPPSLCELLDILRPLKEITEINFRSRKPPFAVRSAKSFVPLCVWMIFQTTEWRLVKRKNSYGFLLGLKKRLVGGAKRRHPTELFMRWSMCQPWFNNLLKRRMEKYLLLVLQDNDYIWLLIFKIQVVLSYELYS